MKKDQGPSGDQPRIEHDPSKLAELIRDVRVAFLVTFPPGAPAGAAGGASMTQPGHAHGVHARPLYTQRVEPDNFDGQLWFMTDAGSPKVEEINQNHPVVITYADPGKNRYVVVYGQAFCEKNPDKARELWSIHAKGWWPGGPTDPGLILLRVQVESAEYWDGPSNTSYMIHLMAAVAKGERVHSRGDHAKVV